MIVTRGFSKRGTARGGVIVTHAYGLFKLGTILRMKVLTRENRRAVGSQVEGRDV